MKRTVRALLRSVPAPIKTVIGRRPGVFIALGCITAVLCLLVCWNADSQPREWKAVEVPVVFWSWKSDAPTHARVECAIERAGARALFMHAGQIDFESGAVRRIRAVTGTFPKGIELHLVYNATSDLLAQCERLDPEVLASAICDTYAADLARARAEGVPVSGLQLDMDVPTRLLPRYERILRSVRSRVPGGTKLSITGLPTWMTSGSLSPALEAVDFWIPQCYGAEIPSRLERAIPISSQRQVEVAIDRARRLGKPFFAGLAAYGYAIHFDRDGKRVQISGSLDPEIVVRNSSLEFVDRGRFDNGEAQVARERRLVYRARESCSVGEMIMHKGEWLMLDLPSAETLRATASAVRKRGGERLLGICVFRLPTAGDTTILTVEEIAAALSDRAPSAALELTASVRSKDSRPDLTMVEIVCSNTGTESALLGEDALTLDLNIAGNRLRRLGPNGFDSSEPLFVPSSVRGEGTVCAARRANLIRLAKRKWSPGMTVSAILEFVTPPTDAISVVITTRTDEVHVREETRSLKIERTVARE